MKTIILTAFCLLPWFAFGQFEKGQIYLGGTLSASTNSGSPSSSNSITTNAFMISPNFGFFLTPKLSLGFSASYSYSNSQYFLPQAGIILAGATNAFSFSPRARYFIPISNSFFIAFQGQLNYSRTYSPTLINDTQDYSIGLNLNPAFIFFPSPKWGIESTIGSIGFSKIHNTQPDSFNNSFFLNTGTFSFGIAYYFKRK